MNRSRRSIILISLCGVVLTALIVGIYLRARSDVPEIYLPDAVETTTAGEEIGIYGGLERVKVTADNVQAVIGTLNLNRPSCYSRTLRIEKFWDGGTSAYDIDVVVYQGITKASNFGIGKMVIVTPENLYIWYEGNTDYYKGRVAPQGGSEYIAQQYQEIITCEEILSLDKNSIVEADYAVYEGEQCIYVEYLEENLGYRMKAYVSITSGLLFAAEEFDGDMRIYKMSESKISFELPPESDFELPDGVNVLVSEEGAG